MYINDISHVVRYSNVELYVDDTLLYFASDDVNIIESNLSSDLDSVTQWLSANYLILNSTKSKSCLWVPMKGLPLSRSPYHLTAET